MSFIYEDEDLIYQLLKLSQTASQPTPKQFIDLAKELVKNLQTELAGGTVFTAERDNADLSQAHIVNVNELLFFLNYNEIKANGKSLVFRAPNFDLSKLGNDSKLYVPYPPQGEAQYYVYRDGLSRYLKDLRDKAANNPVFSAMIAKLSEKVNTELPAPKAPVTLPAGSEEAKIPSPEKDHGGPQTGTPGQVTSQTLQQMAAALPLDPDDIDFTRIRYFLDLFKQLLANSTNTRAGDIITSMNTVEEKMRLITGMTRTGIMQFNLYSDPKSVANMLRPPITGSYVPFLHNLQFVVDNVARIVDAFFAMYARPIPGEATRPTFNNSQRSLIEAQSRGSDSYAMRNKENLQSLINRYNEVVKFV